MPLKNLMSYRSSENERLDVITKQYQKKAGMRDILLVIGIDYKSATATLSSSHSITPGTGARNPAVICH
jgi:hypothetical protein